MTADALVPIADGGITNTRTTVCVTGAGGYVASWLVKILLEKVYTVKGTVRDPDDDQSNAHLKAMKGAEERLILCKANLLDYQALREAIDGCCGIFHTASPVTDDPEEMVEPAVRGARYVIDAAADAGTVRRVVFTSSVGAITMNPSRGADVVVDESCWSDLDYCKKPSNWYCYGKALAEQVAWAAAKERGVELAVVNPVLVLGPPLQTKVNASLRHVMKYLDGSVRTYANAVQAYVDVRDVAEAHVRVYEAEGAAGKRFLCAEAVLHRGDLVRALADLFPEYPLPDKCSDEINPRERIYKFSNKRLTDLDMQFTPIYCSLHDTVISLQEKGYLPKTCCN